MALKFIGEAMQEFQEQAWVSYTEVRGGGGGLLTALGFNPTWEAVAAQLFVIVFAVASYLALDRRARSAAPGSGQTHAS
jgi:high-affinity iron transporter